MRHNNEAIGTRLAVFILLFVVSVVLACFVASLTVGPNFAGISHVLLSFLCALPVAIGLFVFLNTRIKKRGFLRTFLPLAVFPLLFGLMVIYTMFYERNPQHMFHIFIADPIPSGVTDIQAADISGGFSEDVVIAFQASPEIIDSIMAQKQLKKAEDPSDGKYEFPGEYLSQNQYSWGTNWVWYQRVVTRDGTEDGPLDYFIMMWVDPVQSIAIYRTAN